MKLGLTGSIGMGKSTVTAMFRDLGVSVFDADAAVHELYGRDGEAVAEIARIFPDAVVDGSVDRQILSRLVLGHPEELKKLEAIVHPLVQKLRQRVMEEAVRRGEKFVVLDIPLLYETGGEGRCDFVAVVSASAEEQRRRVLQRLGMTEEKFEAVLKHQVPDNEKRRRADFVIPTSGSKEETAKYVAEIARLLSSDSEPNPEEYSLNRE